jgi:hypothetical protein
MKTEPDWIDVVAMVAMLAILSKAKGGTPLAVARSAYDFAEAMMEERDRLYPDGGRND